MANNDMMHAVAEMVAAIGYEVFLWEDAEFFGVAYRIVQVNPLGLWIVIKEGTMIEVGATLNSKTWKVDGGVLLDLADPTTTEEKLRAVIKERA